MVFEIITNSFGENMKLILTGAAMVSQETVDFLSVCCSCPIMEIYGQSEMCGPISGTIITDTISNRGIRPWKHTVEL